MKYLRLFKYKFQTSHYLGIIFFLLVIALFLYGISTTRHESIERQEDALTKAMERNIIHCYALEGFYPPSLSYIEEHYGLTYDSEQFFIDYQPIGSNIHPDFTIINKGEQP